MSEETCCICGEVAKSPYIFIQHLGRSGKSRMYVGHKRCLSLLDSKLKQGEKIKYSELDIPITWR